MSKIYNNISKPCQNLESESINLFRIPKKKRKKKSNTYGSRGHTRMHGLFYFLKNIDDRSSI